MGKKITIVGGAGAIGGGHAFILAKAGHTVTILDARPNGQPGESYRNASGAPVIRFRYPEMDEVSANIPEDGESIEQFKNRFVGFHDALKPCFSVSHSNDRLTQQECLSIIDETISLPIDRIQFAQASSDITERQDVIITTVKCAALTLELGKKINDIPQNASTPVLVFTNGIQPWIMPEANFGGLRLKSISAIYDFVDCVGVDKVKAGVLIKYGAAIEGDGAFCVRSRFFNTKNIIANIDNTDITPELELISNIYTQAGINTTPTSEIKSIILEKLIYNLAGSIMGAIFNYKMGELISNESTKRAVEACAKEFYQFAVKFDVQLAPSEHEFVMLTIKALQNNYNVVSSPLQDIRGGRATEKDFLIKAPIELANTLGMEMPVLQAMYNLMSIIENKARQEISLGRDLQEAVLKQINDADIISVADKYSYLQQPNGLVRKSLLSWLEAVNDEPSEPANSMQATV